MKQPPLGWFRWDFGLAGVGIYSVVVLVANLDKDWTTISYLVLRQAAVTFLLTSSLMGFVLHQATEASYTKAYFWGVFVPALSTALAGFVAHWYFTNEARNILVPFIVSLILNGTALTLAKFGHGSFGAQLRFFWRLMMKR